MLFHLLEQMQWDFKLKSSKLSLQVQMNLTAL